MILTLCFTKTQRNRLMYKRFDDCSELLKTTTLKPPRTDTNLQTFTYCGGGKRSEKLTLYRLPCSCERAPCRAGGGQWEPTHCLLSCKTTYKRNRSVARGTIP